MPPAPMNSRTFRVDVRSQMTRRLARYIEQQSVHRTFTSVAGDVGVDEKTVRNLFRAYVERLDAETVFETPERMGIDEVHLLKKPRCVLTNLTERTIFGVLEKRDKKTVTAHLKSLPERETVKVVTMDMWRPYLDAVGETMPQAAVVVDKFHVVRMARSSQASGVGPISGSASRGVCPTPTRSPGPASRSATRPPTPRTGTPRRGTDPRGPAPSWRKADRRQPERGCHALYRHGGPAPAAAQQHHQLHPGGQCARRVARTRCPGRSTDSWLVIPVLFEL